MSTEKTEILNIEDLKQDIRNFNTGTEAGAKLMRKSFEQFGAGRSVLIDRDNNIIAGNKSQKAAIEAGIKRVRIIETDGSELIAVRRTDIDIDSREGRELALADNATQQVNLAWDKDVLQDVSAEFEIDIDDWGVDTSQFDTETPQEKEVTEDDFEEDKDEVQTICKLGDVWQLGNHRLMCGDSTSAEDVATLMRGGAADLWLTDPPYNVAVKNSQWMTIQNDNLSSNAFAEFLTKSFSAANTVLSNGCPFYIWFASCEHINFEQALIKNRLNVKQELIWNKNHFRLGRSHYQWKHEHCLYGWKGDSCKYFIGHRNLSTVIEDEKEINIDAMKKSEMAELLHRIYEEKTPTTVINENKPVIDSDHPTMKPVRLFGRLIVNSSRHGEIVLDTFGGSGTTIIACEQLDRKARLMELDPHYCDVIIARWEKLTGEKAVRILPAATK